MFKIVLVSSNTQSIALWTRFLCVNTTGVATLLDAEETKGRISSSLTAFSVLHKSLITGESVTFGPQVDVMLRSKYPISRIVGDTAEIRNSSFLDMTAEYIANGNMILPPTRFCDCVRTAASCQ
jgi:hypothetical protein